jgi:hypothetical protein
VFLRSILVPVSLMSVCGRAELGINRAHEGEEFAMAKQKVYTVQKRSSKPGWKVKKKGGKVVAKTATKAELSGPHDSTVASCAPRSRSQGGRQVQEERTYPRGSNPSKSKG